jgi:hypothetical protein
MEKWFLINKTKKPLPQKPLLASLGCNSYILVARD